jgi:hypothetical protein
MEDEMAKKEAVKKVGASEEIGECEVVVPKVAYSDVEKVLATLKKARVTDVFARLELAERQRTLRLIMEPVNEARELPERIKKYNSEVSGVYQKYGRRTVFPGGESGYKLLPEKASEANAELAELRKKYSDDLDKEDGRMKQIAELMERPVDGGFRIDILEYSWLGDNLDNNDIELLLGYGLIRKDADKGKKSCEKFKH